MENKDILEFINSVIKKKFEKKDKGYNPLEVDQTLDAIFKNFSVYIQDLEKITKKYDELEKNYGTLLTKYEMIEKQNKIYLSEIQRYESSGASINILKGQMDQLQNELKNVKKGGTKKVQD